MLGAIIICFIVGLLIIAPFSENGRGCLGIIGALIGIVILGAIALFGFALLLQGS